MPNINTFLNGLVDVHPNAVVLDTKFKRHHAKTFLTPPLNVKSPMERLELFFKYHDINGHDECDEECFEELFSITSFTVPEIENIEKGTRGQNMNENWHKFRNGVLTSSNFHTICHTRDGFEKALSLLQGSKLNEQSLPLQIQFGRQYEDKARNMYLSCHKFTHRKCKVEVPGIIFSKKDPFIASSPDGIISCEKCGTFLVEIKFPKNIPKHRNFFPRNAGVKSGILIKNPDGHYRVRKNRLSDCPG